MTAIDQDNTPVKSNVNMPFNCNRFDGSSSLLFENHSVLYVLCLSYCRLLLLFPLRFALHHLLLLLRPAASTVRSPRLQSAVGLTV